MTLDAQEILVAKKKSTNRAAATQSALRYLESKAELVGAIGEALDVVADIDVEIEAAKARRIDAEERVREAYQAAIGGGWTASELKEIGYDAPRRRRRRPAAEKPDDRQHEGSAEQHSSDHPHESQL
ncbi:hypothetical protein [Dietzia cercidiphylli]|uniref:hypothetical protein n=1 Tax=Dietzia cercidiphylli TaxID=498199 RepID=UPI00223BBC50|nr:hypothetical protein [Dietzia cercidiphylli]MCT1515303.1 hypothetical protein [Dietzia cercidiphylli]